MQITAFRQFRAALLALPKLGRRLREMGFRSFSLVRKKNGVHASPPQHTRVVGPYHILRLGDRIGLA